MSLWRGTLWLGMGRCLPAVQSWQPGLEAARKIIFPGDFEMIQRKEQFRNRILNNRILIKEIMLSVLLVRITAYRVYMLSTLHTLYKTLNYSKVRRFYSKLSRFF